MAERNDASQVCNRNSKIGCYEMYVLWIDTSADTFPFDNRKNIINWIVIKREKFSELLVVEIVDYQEPDSIRISNVDVINL
jgi:hypothetical protein